MSLVIEDKLIPFAALLFGVAIATSTALMSGSYILLIVLVLLSSKARSLIVDSFKNKFVLCGFIFYILVLLGMLWSDADFHDRSKMALRVIGFGFLPIFFAGLRIRNSAKLLLQAFIAGEILSAIISIGAWAFHHPVLMGLSDGVTEGAIFKWVVFRGHLIHVAFLAVAVNFLLWEIINKSHSTKIKLVLSFFYLISVFDLMFLVQGRTGQVMFLGITFVVLISKFRLKGLLSFIVILAIAVPLLYEFSPAVRSGLLEYANERSEMQQGNYNTSAGLRAQFHKNSLIMFKQSPIVGHGTGSYPSHYKALIAGTDQAINTQPHGDLYLVAVELGVIGLLAFIAMLFANAFELFKMKNRSMQTMGFALLAGYLIALTQNSFFTDNVTGLAFMFLMLSIQAIGLTKLESLT